LEEKTSLDLAYRWFCRLNLTEHVKDYTVFSIKSRDELMFRDIL